MSKAPISLQSDYGPIGRPLTTRLDWNDLVQPPEVIDRIEHIVAWLEYSEKILEDWGFGARFGRGYHALFYGPPGTGKTLTAALIGNRVGRDVIRVDLAQVVSKYIGETEKNLSLLFDAAERSGAILFFDEADALFGKRTEIKSANDRYANQEVSYLLSRIEAHPGLVILASNLRDNINDAFFRRFQLSVGFSAPDTGARLRLWNAVFDGSTHETDGLDLASLAQSHELLAGEINNAVRFAAVTALQRGGDQISQADLLLGIAEVVRAQDDGGT